LLNFKYLIAPPNGIAMLDFSSLLLVGQTDSPNSKLTSVVESMLLFIAQANRTMAEFRIAYLLLLYNSDFNILMMLLHRPNVYTFGGVFTVENTRSVLFKGLFAAIINVAG